MLARFLVVLRRVVPNREELFQGEQGLAAQLQHVALDREADARFGLGREEGAVEVGDALVVPGRPRRKVAVQEVVQVFVKDDRARIRVPAGRQRDEVALARALKKAGGPAGLSPKERLVRFQRRVALEDEDRRRHGIAGGQRLAEQQQNRA